MFNPTPVFGVWAIEDSDGDGRLLALGLTESQADFAAELLNADGLGDLTGLQPRDLDEEIWEAATVTACTVCMRQKFAAELDTSGRCKECAP